MQICSSCTLLSRNKKRNEKITDKIYEKNMTAVPSVSTKYEVVSLCQKNFSQQGFMNTGYAESTFTDGKYS